MLLNLFYPSQIVHHKNLCHIQLYLSIKILRYLKNGFFALLILKIDGKLYLSQIQIKNNNLIFFILASPTANILVSYPIQINNKNTHIKSQNLKQIKLRKNKFIIFIYAFIN